MGWTWGHLPSPCAPGFGAPPEVVMGNQIWLLKGTLGGSPPGVGAWNAAVLGLGLGPPRASTPRGLLQGALPSWRAGASVAVGPPSPSGQRLQDILTRLIAELRAPAQCGSRRKAPFVPQRMCFQRLPLETRSHFLPLFPSWPREAGVGIGQTAVRLLLEGFLWTRQGASQKVAAVTRMPLPRGRSSGTERASMPRVTQEEGAELGCAHRHSDPRRAQGTTLSPTNGCFRLLSFGAPNEVCACILACTPCV